MNAIDKVVTKIKGKLGFCQAKGCWRRDLYEINIKEIKLKRHLCHKHTKELVKILGGKETSEIKICEVNNAPCNSCKPVCDDWIYKENK